ncbi:hypothetical protein [Hydrogenophaga sp. H7]|uniref:hypothetical protein n=1 Tax=Hydrogenophaga sp. H7 TaxID=1882399 RepID=UPI0009A28E66|nr:hypothetical protein [Hydrogenophaga sp. H7]OPF62020.1 hypothetical protein BC358_15380 [Hydrogenophaga sp. H7]
MHTALLRSQRNHVFAVIKEAGFDPLDFDWSKTSTRWHDNGDSPVEELIHSPTGFHFVFDRFEGRANPRFTPREDRAAELDCGQVDSWEEVRHQLRRWLEIVKNEVEQPDLWVLAKEDKKLVAARIDDIENAPFSLNEQERIRLAVGEIHAFLKSSAEHSQSDLQFIQARLEHLADSSSRLGRKDWITLAMGTLTNIVVGVALAPEAARELVRTAGALLGWVVGNAQLLP